MSIKQLSLKDFAYKPQRAKKGKIKALEIFPIIAHAISKSKTRSLSIGDIAKKLNWSRQRISYHLRSLCKKGFLIKDKKGRFVFYRINQQTIENYFHGTDKKKIRYGTLKSIPFVQYVFVSYPLLKGTLIKTTSPVNRGRYTSYKWEGIWRGKELRVEYFPYRVRIEFRNFHFRDSSLIEKEARHTAYEFLNEEILSRYPQNKYGPPKVYSHCPIPSRIAEKVLNSQEIDYQDNDVFHLDRTGPSAEELGMDEDQVPQGYMEITKLPVFEEIMSIYQTKRNTIDEVINTVKEQSKMLQDSMQVIQDQKQMIESLKDEVRALQEDRFSKSSEDLNYIG